LDSENSLIFLIDALILGGMVESFFISDYKALLIKPRRDVFASSLSLMLHHLRNFSLRT